MKTVVDNLIIGSNWLLSLACMCLLIILCGVGGGLVEV